MEEMHGQMIRQLLITPGMDGARQLLIATMPGTPQIAIMGPQPQGGAMGTKARPVMHGMHQAQAVIMGGAALTGMIATQITKAGHAQAVTIHGAALTGMIATQITKPGLRMKRMALKILIIPLGTLRM